MSDIREIDDRIPSSAFEDRFEHYFSSKLGSDQMRSKIKEIFGEQVNTVNFANKIKKYAAEEMDNRLFRSFNYWVIVILTTMITAGISSFIAILFAKK